VYYYYEDGTTRYIDSDRLVAVDRWKGKDIGWAGYFEALLQGGFFIVSSFDRFLPSFFFRAAYLTTGIFSLYCGMDFKSTHVASCIFPSNFTSRRSFGLRTEKKERNYCTTDGRPSSKILAVPVCEDDALEVD